MDDVKAKQQIVEKIKASTNILVTVSNDPSVDALSAALGLTLILDKLEKHPTAVFSGAVPPAISFLEPEKTFDSTTDSLRDFIIALDKAKADHLRYKVEGDAVKIFITPYKTTITSDDLEFSQGDFNVELVIALGVDKQEHLDAALEAHGQILHDATIITATAGEQTSTLGGIDWHDAQSSSLSEMIAGLSEALKTDKTKTLLDGQIATAFLTGIVSATDRFSNTHTTSRVMTIAAQLMAAGADQQLIASKLEGTHEISGSDTAQSTSVDTPSEDSEESKTSLNISHDPNETLEEMDKRVKAAEQKEAAGVAEEALSQQTNTEEPSSDISAPKSESVTNAYTLDPENQAVEPSLGGTLNATTEQAAEDNRNEIEDDRNKTLLSHSYVGGDTGSSPIAAPSATDAAHEFLGNAAAPGSSSVNAIPVPQAGELVHSAYADDPQPSTTPEPTTPSIEPVPTPVVVTPPAPADLGLPMPPPLPDFSQLPPAPAPNFGASPSVSPPEILGDILKPETTVPPVEPTEPPVTSASLPPMPQPNPVNPNDPGQFKIPGQQ
jgi:nanoRNase/pAp phosphatase (c-di-AMP/oligoRNAs hydrolase)